MPKRRNTSWSRNKKEKQIITRRLIEISLKVENCVYKHVPISLCEAEQYLREVSSYKLQCNGDERSLQVIEKLTRCMKAIILDHQELAVDNPTIPNASTVADSFVRADTNSPVYSIPDEDRILTQITEASPANVVHQDVEIIDLSDIEDDGDLMPDDDDDLMPNDTSPKTVDFAGSRMTVEVDIHREMSNLFLRDDADPLEITTSTDVNYSQSILNNFEGVEYVKQNEISVFKITADNGLVSNVIDKGKTSQASGNTAFATITNKNITSITELNKFIIADVSQNKVTESTLTNTDSKDLTLKNKEHLKMCTYNNLTATSNYKENINTISSQTFYPVINKNPETQRQTCYDSNRTCTNNDYYQKSKDANTTKPTNLYKITNKGNWNVDMPTNAFYSAGKENQFTKVTENSKPTGQTRSITNTAVAVVTEIPTATKKKRGPRKKKVVDEKEIKPKNKRVNRGPKSNKENVAANPDKNKILPIYNENVINDLSWIENIRYIREIQADENDSKLNFEESFWDNYFLPANWSENEFM